MGEKAPGGEQNGRDAAASHLVGGALRRVAARFTLDECHLLLHVVIHRELVRVGPQAQGVVLFLFHVDPVGDEVFVEDVAA